MANEPKRLECHVPRDPMLGHGDDLRCPNIRGDVAMQGCDCTTPCPSAARAMIAVEWYDLRRPILD